MPDSDMSSVIASTVLVGMSVCLLHQPQRGKMDCEPYGPYTDLGMLETTTIQLQH